VMELEVIDIDKQKKIILDILLFINDFCEKNRIKWYIAYGTLLGAIRHEGFIPWDDDIDIMMLREDYNHFIQAFGERQGYYYLASFENDTYYYPFSKVIDLRTSIKNDVIKDYKNQGLCVDIFVVDYIDNDERKARKIIKKSVDDKRLLNYALLKDNDFKKKDNYIIRNLLYLVSHFIGSDALVKAFRRKLKKYCAKEKKVYCGCIGESCEIYRSDAFDGIKRMAFEGYMFPAPLNYDVLLKESYGDYMQLPPAELRVSHGQEAFFIGEMI